MTDFAYWTQWIACVLGLMGALLLATKGRHARYGWLFFMASNAGWITFGYLTGASGLTVQQLGFSITSCIGIYQWFVKPVRDSGLHTVNEATEHR